MKNLFENWRRFVITEGKDLNWSAKCMIFDDAGRVMLVQVAKKGTWDFPGGHGMNSETPVEAVKREVFEEVGLKIDQIEEIGQIQTEAGAEVQRYIFSAMNFSGAFNIQLAEISDYVWVTIDKLIIDTHKTPKTFESTVVLTFQKYTDQIRQLKLKADKINYYEEHPRLNPQDRKLFPI